MKRKQFFGLFLLLFFCSSFLSLLTTDNISNISQINRNSNQNTNIITPKTSDVIKKPLNYTNFFQNTTIVRRSFEGINFTINASSYFSDGANYSIVQIAFTNNTIVNYTMTDLGNGNYTYTYNPENYAPIGFQNVSFLIFNKSVGEYLEQLNNQTTFTNFTIISNSMVGLNSSEYNRGEFLNAEIMVKDDITSWSVYLTNDKNGNEDTVELMGSNIFQFSREVDEWFIDVNVYYYVRVNVTYGSQKTAEYFRFKILNSPPIIITTSVIFDPVSVFREELFSIEFNVSDYEDVSTSFFNASLIIEDPDGIEALTYNKDDMEYLPDGVIRRRYMTISASRPAGTYRVYINVQDSDGGTDTYTTFLTVKNNLPIIYDYKINDYSLNDSISVLYGEDLVFTFNVSDVEGIAFITVALLNEQNEWFNITRAYTDENMTITIRSIELIKGRWYVYIFVIDTDGAIIGLDTDYILGPKEIEIIPDILGVVLPWIAFFIGIGLGLIFGAFIGIVRIKKKISITQPLSKTTPAKPIVEKKKVEKKLEKEEIKKPISKKLTCKKCGASLDSDSVKCPKCGDQIEVPEKKSKEEKLPQRKIKRKL